MGQQEDEHKRQEREVEVLDGLRIWIGCREAKDRVEQIDEYELVEYLKVLVLAVYERFIADEVDNLHVGD